MIKKQLESATDLVNAARAISEVVYLAVAEATIPEHTAIFRQVLQDVDDKLSRASRELREIARSIGEE